MSGSTTTQKPKQATSRSAVKVPVKLPKLEAGKQAETYWIGVTLDCPFQNVSVGGVTFPKYRGKLINEGSGEMLPDADLQKGIHAPLSREQVDLICKGVQLRVVRVLGRAPQPEEGVPDFGTPRTNKLAQMLMVDGPKYRTQANDVPLAKFLYMHRLADLSMDEANRFPPETMAEE